MVACHLRNCAACVERLDSAPGGWRRCALAFLEAQSWGEAFRNLDGASRDRSLALAAFAGPAPAPRASCRPPRPGQRRAGGRDRPLRVFSGLDGSWLEHPRQARGGSRRDGLARPGGARDWRPWIAGNQDARAGDHRRSSHGSSSHRSRGGPTANRYRRSGGGRGADPRRTGNQRSLADGAASPGLGA